jgi:Acetyltransferase (GNAT) domain
VRRYRQGFKIGPLFAETLEISDRLFQSLTHGSDRQTVFIDIPDVNSALPMLVKRYRFQPVLTCVRMYWGSGVNLEVERIFGAATLELD